MKKTIPLILTLTCLALLLPNTSKSQTEALSEVFFKANQAFKADRFDEAVEGYNKLLLLGHESGDLYYNLGNAYFRMNQLGRAILNYELARLFMPRDADLNFNLSHALDQIVDDVPEEKDFVVMTFFWLDSLSMAELFFGFALINILFWGILFIRLFFRMEWTYYMTIIFLIFWIISGTSFGLKWYQRGTDDRAVIIREEVNIMAGPDEKDTVLFKLHEGTIIHNERSEDGWSLVSLSNEKRGWIRSESIKEIQSHRPGPV